MSNKYTRYDVIIYAIILFLGLLLRLYKINSPLADWHSFRQADTASVTRLFVENGIDLLNPRYHDISRVQSGKFNPEGFRSVELPIYNALHALTVKFVPFLTFESVGRLLSVIFALITSIFLFKIGSHYFGKPVGKLTMFLYLVLPFNIYFTRVILPEPLAVMLGVIGLWFFVKYSEKKNLVDLILYASFMSLSVLVKPYMVFFNFYVIYFFVKEFGIKKFWFKKEVIILSIIIFIPFLLWRIRISEHPEGIPFWKWTFNGDGVRLKPAFWYWIFGERVGKLILGVWGVYPLSLGIINNRKNPFLISLCFGMLAYVTIVATANVRHDYYQTLLIPLISILLALGFSELIESFRKVKWGFLYPAAIFVMMILISLFQVKEYYKINHPEILVAGEAVDRLTPKDSLVIASYNGDTAFLYQTKRRGWPVVELPIDELIAEGASYFVSVNLNDSQTIEFVNRFEVLEKTNTYVLLKLN